jgi:hypothetical protein
MEQALESIRNAWQTSEGISWGLAGEVLGAVVLLGLFIFVIKNAKSFRSKLNKK